MRSVSQHQSKTNADAMPGRKRSSRSAVAATPSIGVDIDMTARQRLKTILQLAIAIGRREGLIGNNGAHPVTESTHNKGERASMIIKPFADTA